MDVETTAVNVDVNGTIVRVEVEATQIGGREKVGVMDALPFEDLTDSIEAIAVALTATLQKVKPRKATVEFGVEVGVESGKLTALICKGSGKANLKVALEWGE